MLHSGSRALLLSLLTLVPSAAAAQFTLTELALSVRVKATNGTDSVFEVTFSVAGTELGTATVTPQGPGGTAIDLPCSSATSCSLTQNLTKAAFDQLFPSSARDFKIDLTQAPVNGTDTITDTFSFTLPVVPSPAISFPTSSEPIDPVSLEVMFSACASCSEATHAVLTLATTELAMQNLPSSATTWTPAFTLDPNTSGYGVEINHKTSGSLTPAPRYEPGDVPYAFTFVVEHSDSVAFSTSFAPPTGTFCIVVNDSAADCTAITEPAAGLLNTSSPPAYVTTAAGIAIQYSLQLAASGQLSGIADADLDGDTLFESEAPSELDGRLKGKDGLLRQRIRIPFDVPASDTKFKVRIREEANLATLQGSPDLAWLFEQKTRGKDGAAKLSETTTGTRITPLAVTGWKLEFTLPAAQGPITGQLSLTGGASVALRGSQDFDSEANRSDLRLQSDGADRGVRIRIKKLVIDTAQANKADQITSGSVRMRAFGQRSSLLLP